MTDLLSAIADAIEQDAWSHHAAGQDAVAQYAFDLSARLRHMIDAADEVATDGSR